MSAATQQLITILGVLLGAAASFAASTATERVKWKRSQSSRWDDRRLAAYSDYANAVKRCTELAERISATRGYATTRFAAAGPELLPPESGIQLLAAAEAERTVVWERVRLLGAPSAVDAARRWHESAWTLGAIARGKPVNEQEFLGLHDALDRRRNEFYVAARADLGVSSGNPTEPEPNQLAAIEEINCGGLARRVPDSAQHETNAR